MLTRVGYMKMEGYIYENYKAEYYLFYSQPVVGFRMSREREAKSLRLQSKSIYFLK